jgi:hypothetical protein
MIMLLAEIKAQSCKQEKGPGDFPEFIQPDISGAPKLGRPVLITGDKKPVMGEGHGWAAPAVFDWNGDGKKDLLIGEFASGWEMANGNVIGNFIRVYLNEGSDSSPEFTDAFKYAMPYVEPSKGTESNGTPLSVFLWCCMSFRPQFADLNDDGYPDLITGHYYPGDVTWFRGSGQGFSLGEKIEQEYRDKHPLYGNDLPVTDPQSHSYWNYSSVSFGDFDGDGLLDMVVGGAGLRLSKNIGSKTEPKFGKRELLLDVNGNPLKIYAYTKEDVKDYKGTLPVAGSGNTVPLVTDWDQDGIMDLLVTDCYLNKGQAAVTFFRGVRTKEGVRFEPGVPLFKTKDGGKAFPGSWLQTYVTDWNNDGVNDLLIGTSVATIDGIFNYDLSWNWESETGITKKNPANYSENYKKMIEEQMERADKYVTELGIDSEEARKRNLVTREMLFKNYYGKEEYRTLAHKGYMYVMLGEKQNNPDTTNLAKEKFLIKEQTKIREQGKITEQNQIEGQNKIVKQNPKAGQAQVKGETKVTEQKKSGSPVRVTAKTPIAVYAGEKFTVKIVLDIQEQWYIYAPARTNAEQGVTQASISFELPEGIAMEGKIEWPEPVAKDLYQVYFGERELNPVFKVLPGTKPGLYIIKAKLQYQGCNELSCLPPSKEDLLIEINVNQS